MNQPERLTAEVHESGGDSGSKSGGCGTTVLRFVRRWFIVLTLYTLSIGPMFWPWYEAKYLNGSFWLAAFYEPLLYVADACPPFGNWLNWYIELWTLA